MEIAFVSSNKLRIELEKKQGSLPSRIISIFTKNNGQYIATMLIGNNIALVIYGIIMAEILEPQIRLYLPHSEIWVLTIETVVSTLIILITAEFLPKTLFRISPNLVLNILSFPVLVFYFLLYPISKFSVELSNFLLKKLLKVNISKQQTSNVFCKIDLDNFLKESKNEHNENDEIEHDIKIFQNALDFSSVKLRECIVPRTEVAALDVNSSIETLRTKFIESGFSKILIYEESIDNIIGYTHSSSLFKKPADIRSILVKLLIVPETMPANKLLNSFIKERKSLALVVDEFGGTAGIVTIEDIMEEIFGEIEDEHDFIDWEEKQVAENEYIFSGRLEIDYINEKYNLSIPSGEDNYETIAGFILYHNEDIPSINDAISITPYNFKILKVTHPRIDLVQMKIMD